MPVLAGRVLGIGAIDWIGITLAMSVLFWIPSHILTFSMRYHQDYLAAGIPTFPTPLWFPIYADDHCWIQCTGWIDDGCGLHLASSLPRDS